MWLVAVQTTYSQSKGYRSYSNDREVGGPKATSPGTAWGSEDDDEDAHGGDEDEDDKDDGLDSEEDVGVAADNAATAAEDEDDEPAADTSDGAGDPVFGLRGGKTGTGLGRERDRQGICMGDGRGDGRWDEGVEWEEGMEAASRQSYRRDISPLVQ